MPAERASTVLEAGTSIGQRKLEWLLQEPAFYNRLQKQSQVVNLRNNGNGSYSGTFNQTSIPGTYRVIFEISGSVEGVGFIERKETLTCDYEFHLLDFGLSGVKVVDSGKKDGDLRLQMLEFRPRNAQNHYLGPDYGHKLSIRIGGTDRSTSIRDLGDGTYQLPFNAAIGTDPEVQIQVLEEELYRGPASELQPKLSKWSLSAHLGYPIWRDTSNQLSGQSLVELDAEYRFRPRLSAQLNAGYYRFNNEESTVGATLQLKGYTAPRNGWQLYGEAGPGYYNPITRMDPLR